MPIGFPFGSAGSTGGSRVQVFKDGKFTINPTKNDGVIQPNQTLRLSGTQQLIVPYVKTDEMVFVKYKKMSNGGYFGLLTNSTRNSVTTVAEKDVQVGLYDNANDFVVIGLQTKTVINCTVTYGLATVPATVDILEIWTEKA